MSLLERGLASLDMTVSTPRNIKGFIHHPPDNLKLYVKYRGDISPGQGGGRDAAPLGIAPKNIQGTILDARIYPTGMRFMIMLQVTKSPDAGDVGRAIDIYPTRDIISLYPFRSLKDLVNPLMEKEKLKTLKGYANIHNQLAFLPEDEDGMAGRETIKAKARFEDKEPEFPLKGPDAEYHHDEYQGQRYVTAMKKSGQIQDETGNKYIDDSKLGGRKKTRKRRRKKAKKSRKRRKKKTKKRRRKKKKKTKRRR